MKHMIIFLLGILFFSCKTDITEYDLYHCSCPQEILDMAAEEDSVYWDCTWQTAYNNGRVSYITKEDGTLLSLVRTYPAHY